MGPLYTHALTAAHHLIAAVFPGHCEQCAAPLAHDEAVLCGACRKTLTPLSSRHRCERCENPLSGGEVCSCEKLPSFGMSRSLFTFEGYTAELVHRMKFSHRHAVAGLFGSMLADRFRDYIALHDIITPMPLHARRRRTRGYNQSERIARTMALQSGVPLIEAAKRIRHTKPLTVSRNAAERTEIITGAFTAVNAESFHGMSVLIVDDVLTTGTTVNELARVLREAGALKVNALTVARAD